jgi:hypothetical protein
LSVCYRDALIWAERGRRGPCREKLAKKRANNGPGEGEMHVAGYPLPQAGRHVSNREKRWIRPWTPRGFLGGFWAG